MIYFGVNKSYCFGSFNGIVFNLSWIRVNFIWNVYWIYISIVIIYIFNCFFIKFFNVFWKINFKDCVNYYVKFLCFEGW